MGRYLYGENSIIDFSKRDEQLDYCPYEMTDEEEQEDDAEGGYFEDD